VSSRLANEHEILSSLNQGVAGEINIIKKELFDAILSEYLTQKKQLDQSLFIDGDEIHIRNALHDLMENILGIQKIEDPLEAKELKDKIQEEFIALAQIEISPAKITSILADKFYQQFTKVLADISMESWLTEYKTDSDLIHNLEKLDTNFFIPINTLFNVADADKLNIYSLVDTKKTEPDNYYLNCTKEKIHQWIANRLMPNTTKVFATTTDNLTINTTDYMFFWEYKEEANDFENNNSKNYVTLQLSHIKNLDFIDFTDSDPTHHKYLSTHIKKTEVSITLVTQAMEQTNNAETIVDFFTDANVHNKLNQLPILKNKLYNILNDKLTNTNFRQQFSDAVINLITAKNYEFNQDEIYFLVNNSICVDILTAMIKQNISINKLIGIIDINYLNKITTQVLKTFSETAKETLFSIAFNNNNCDLIYKLLTVSDPNKYNNIVSNETIFALAIKDNHVKLAELLLQDTNLNIKDINLFYHFHKGNDKIISLCIKYILKNKDKFSIASFINNIQAKNKKGLPGLWAALESGHDKVVSDYMYLILSCDAFTAEEKLELVKAQTGTCDSGLHLALKNGHHKAVSGYIKHILSCKQFDTEQKLEFIQATTTDGFQGLFAALSSGYDNTVSEYIKLILSCEEFTPEQKLELVQAKCTDGLKGLFAALSSGYDRAVSEYMHLILSCKQFDTEQKLELIQAKSAYDTAKLFTAFEYGHSKTVEEYISIILKDDHLDIYQKKTLIISVKKINNSLCQSLINSSVLTDEEKNYLLE
jgi:hypothetical protein